MPCACAEKASRAAIAAFLRALPEKFTAPVRHACGWTPDVVFRANWPQLAQVVDEVAHAE
jgi:hypothetical protein